ncbi:hypothetical protein MD484_g5276, partial [Candolleomyces efflorescens]
MRAVAPLTDAARARAEKSDPNQGRCLIQNIDDKDVVELTYVFPRERSGDVKMMRSLEYIWGMREGTLNLDTRRNMFFLGEPLRSLYKKRRWALCPEESVVDKFLCPVPDGHHPKPLVRDRFPELSVSANPKPDVTICTLIRVLLPMQDATFKYTFFPLSEMNFGILRQTESTAMGVDNFTVHTHPFATLPPVTSHIHPKFALLQLSSHLFNYRSDPYISKLVKSSRLVRKVLSFYTAWNRVMLPPFADIDPTFVTIPSAPPNLRPHSDDGAHSDNPSDHDEESEEYYEPSDGDSTSTPPRRVWYPPPPPRRFPLVSRSQPQPKRRAGPPDSTGSGADPEPPLKQRKIEEDQEGWSATSITAWARATSESPPVASSTHNASE